MKTNFVPTPAETALIFDGEPIATRLLFRYNDNKSKEDIPMNKSEFVTHCIRHHESFPHVGEIDAAAAGAVLANAASAPAVTAQEFMEEWNRQIRSAAKAAPEKTYKIKPEFIDLWGSDATEDSVITESELKMIARGWEKPVESLLDQLIPQKTDDSFHDIAKSIVSNGMYDAAVRLTDDDIREKLHADLAPCDDVTSLTVYMAAHFEKHGEEFTI